MIRVAKEKEKYYNLLQEELKQRYKDKEKLEELFVAKNLDEYTYQISLKRYNFKKTMMLSVRQSKLMTFSLNILKSKAEISVK
jgi:hypothetical protein